jgi:shikimate kinase
MDSCSLPLSRTTIVLVGLMGAGKTSVGRRLAARLGLRFVDADAEIETAAGASIPAIFAAHGEAYFRDGERRVIARLLDNSGLVLAAGGGAFISPETRRLIKKAAISVWLRAELDVLLERVSRRDNRPLLKDGEPREILARLMEERYPIYAEADIAVDSVDAPHEVMVERVVRALKAYLDRDGEAPP